MAELELPGESELADRIHRRIERWVRSATVIILVYYGGSQYGASHFTSHGLWQNVILLPLAALGSAVIIADTPLRRNGNRPWLSHRLAMWITERRNRMS